MPAGAAKSSRDTPARVTFSGPDEMVTVPAVTFAARVAAVTAAAVPLRHGELVDGDGHARERAVDLEAGQDRRPGRIGGEPRIGRDPVGRGVDGADQRLERGFGRRVGERGGGQEARGGAAMAAIRPRMPRTGLGRFICWPTTFGGADRAASADRGARRASPHRAGPALAGAAVIVMLLGFFRNTSAASMNCVRKAWLSM